MVFDVVSFSASFQVALKYFSVASVIAVFGLWLTGYLGRALRSVYGFEEDGEVTKFSILSICFGLIVGTYWSLRVTKEAIFFDLVGKEYLPRAKMLTPFILFAALYILGFFVDRVRRHRLFAIVCSAYGFVFATIAILMKMGLPEMDHSLINWIPGRAVGWAYFWAVESLGGVIVGAVFWAFVASTTRTESAKRGYPLVFLAAQIGNFLGPAFVAAYSVALGNENIILFLTAILMIIPVIIEFYMQVVPAHLHESDDSGMKKKKTGAMEGLRLIVTKPFLIGVAVVSTIYEVVGTIIDYQFKVTANGVYVKEEYAAFMGIFAMCSATVGILFALGGTNFFIKNFGVRFSLLGYPGLLGIAVVLLWFKPSLSGFFLAMIAVKALSYALNNPVKELLYLPTSKDVKMKAKGFIDGFGSKGSKAIGSIITDQIGKDMAMLLGVGSLISLGIIAGWMLVALAVGTKYDSLVKNKEILE